MSCSFFQGRDNRSADALYKRCTTGVLDFIPLMRISYGFCPSKPFGLLGYQMFAFLFNWTDRNWVRSLPLPFSSSWVVLILPFLPAPASKAQEIQVHA